MYICVRSHVHTSCINQVCVLITAICIIDHTLLSTIRAGIGTLTCTSMASNNSMSGIKCYLAVQVWVHARGTVAALIVQVLILWLIDNSIEFVLD